MNSALAMLQTVTDQRNLPEICPPNVVRLSRARPAIAMQAIVTLDRDQPPAWIECLLRPCDPRGLMQLIRERYAAQGADFDLRILDVALEQAARVRPETRLGINVHPMSLSADGFADRVLEQARRRHVEPSRLVLELVEYEGAIALETARPALEQLRSAGVAIALDDFGPGAPNLDVVADGLVDWIKLDLSLCRHVDTDAGARGVVAGIAALARHAGVGLVAEGVERPSQMRALLAVGIHHQQGFLFHRPAPALQPSISARRH